MSLTHAVLAKNDSDLKLQKLFRLYYLKWTLPAIDKLQSREIGFIPFFGTMTRHRSFNNIRDLSEFVTGIVPRHIYYSSAYYEYPEERVMKEKVWIGAELIFDLDADHIPGASGMKYEDILAEVKKHTHRLIFDFLLDDLGLGEKDLKIFFSGGRGYHVHVVNDWIYSLGSDARREIANYVRGEGLSVHDIRGAMQDTPTRMGGWKRRIDDNMVNFYKLLKAEGADSKVLIDILKDRKKVSRYIQNLAKLIPNTNSRKIDLFTSPGNMKYNFMDESDLAVLSKLIEITESEHQCEIDEPVTTDIHRLIRMPYSLHGKSGLIVKPIEVSDFDSFTPLIDARVEEFSDQELEVDLTADYEINFGGVPYKLSSGRNKLPGDLSVFLVANRMAKFV